MRSSISNFDFAAPLKGALAAVVTVAAAWLVIPARLAIDDQPVQSVVTLNELVVERYISQQTSRPVVFLGSSMLTMIPPSHCRPDNVASLYLQGGSALTGIEIMRRIGAHPEVVFAEATTMHGRSDQRLLGEVFTPLYWRVRMAAPPLRHYRNWMVMLYRALLPPLAPPLDLPAVTIEDWDKGIEPRLDPYRMPSLKLWYNVEERKAIAAAELRALRQRGTRVILYSPADRRVNEASPTRDWLEPLKAELHDFEWFDTPPDLPLYRYDGLHFVAGSGLHYFDYLMKRAGVPFEPKCEPPAVFRG